MFVRVKGSGPHECLQISPAPVFGLLWRETGCRDTIRPLAPVRRRAGGVHDRAPPAHGLRTVPRRDALVPRPGHRGRRRPGPASHATRGGLARRASRRFGFPQPRPPPGPVHQSRPDGAAGQGGQARRTREGVAPPRRPPQSRAGRRGRGHAGGAARLARGKAPRRREGPDRRQRGYRRHLRAGRGALSVDRGKALGEERLDGMWVPRANTALPAFGVALKYRRHWMAGRVFGTAKGLPDTRPVLHRTDATICDHAFRPFPALVLRDRPFRRMECAQWHFL